MTLSPRLAALVIGILLVPLSAAALAADDELSGTVWADLDTNGLREDTENGIAGMGVQLVHMAGGPDGEDSVVQQTTTGPEGTYSFSGLTPGLYAVQFLVPEGLALDEMLFFTRRDMGKDDRVDSDADPFTGRTVPMRFRGKPFRHVDAGLVGPTQLHVIEGVVWEDRDDDGLRQGGEPLMDGVTVNLLKEDPAKDPPKRGKGKSKGGKSKGGKSKAGKSKAGKSKASLEMVDTMTTAGAFGGPPEYYFYVLPSAARYVIEVEPPDSHVIAAQDQDPNDVDDSDVDPDDGRSDPVIADSDHVIDIGLTPLGAIGDYAWLDADDDGIQDPEESGQEDVMVILEHLVVSPDPVDPFAIVETWDIEDLAFTDDDGFYMFGDRRPGTYRLSFVPPAGLGFTLFQEGDDRTVDSDAMPDSGLTPEFNLPDDASPPGEAALERIRAAAERALGEVDPADGEAPAGEAPGAPGAPDDGEDPAGEEDPNAGGAPGAGAGLFPTLYADQWDAGLIPGAGVSTVTVAPDRGPVDCANGKFVNDPEVEITGVEASRQPNGDWVFLVRMANGLKKDYSFAVVLFVRTPTGTQMFLWEVHDKVIRVGEADPQTGELLEEAGEDIQIEHLPEQGIVVFRLKEGVIPEGSDLFQVRSFHSPTKRSATRCHGSETGTLDGSEATDSQTTDPAAP